MTNRKGLATRPSFSRRPFSPFPVCLSLLSSDAGMDLLFLNVGHSSDSDANDVCHRCKTDAKPSQIFNDNVPVIIPSRSCCHIDGLSSLCGAAGTSPANVSS
jgi:hypothetical protein